MGQIRLGETLRRSQRVARATFEAAGSIFHDVEAALTGFDGALGRAADRYAKMHEQKDADLKKALGPLLLEKRNRIHRRFVDLRHAHSQRRKDLDDFSVMFFGKTMAGKSTTIEALAAGDGSSIGAGDPDFTRDIRGRSWDGLTLIDTPGLLGFREELHGVADAYVDRADLICMVVTDDSIEPQLFRRMREVRGQNKHLVVLLNVKAANNPILRHEPEDAFDEREIGELVAFIRERLKEVFAGEPATIIPYCANAAFEAQRCDDLAEREYLWRESKIGAVIGYLVETIERRAVPIRATAAFDSLCHYVQNIAEELEADLPALNGQLNELRRKRTEAERLFNRLWCDSASDLGRLKDHFHRVHEDIHELAWEFARGDRSGSVAASFRDVCQWSKVEEFIGQFESDVLERTRRNLEQFRDTLGEDLAAAVKLAEGPASDLDFEDLDRGSWKRTTGKAVRIVGTAAAGLAGGEVGMWVGAAIGTAILPGLGTTIGGIVGGLIGGLVAGWGAKKLGDSLIENGLKDQLDAQRDLRTVLRDHLWKKYREIDEDLSRWLKDLVATTQSSVVRMLDEYASAVAAIAAGGGSLVQDLHRARHALSRRSFDALLNEVHPAFRDGRVRLVDATQWMQYRAKILIGGSDGRPVTGLVIGRGGELIRAVREHTGNAIDIVEVGAEELTEKMVADALQPARIAPTAVQLGSTVRVSVAAQDIAWVQGRRQRNLLLAKELLGTEIYLRVEPRADGRRR